MLNFCFETPLCQCVMVSAQTPSVTELTLFPHMDFSAVNWTFLTNFYKMTCELRLDPHLVCYFQQLLDSARKERRNGCKNGFSEKQGQKRREGRRKMRHEGLLFFLREYRQHESDLDSKTFKLLSTHKPNTHIVHTVAMQRHLIMCALASVWLMTIGNSSHGLYCISNHHLCCVFMHAVFNLFLWMSVYASHRCDYKQMCSRCVLDITIKTNGIMSCLTAARICPLLSALHFLLQTFSHFINPTVFSHPTFFICTHQSNCLP